MNDLPLTGFPCYAQGTLGSPGSKHWKSLERNVLAKSCFDFQKKRFWEEINAFLPLFYRKCTWTMLIDEKM